MQNAADPIQRGARDRAGVSLTETVDRYATRPMLHNTRGWLTGGYLAPLFPFAYSQTGMPQTCPGLFR